MQPNEPQGFYRPDAGQPAQSAPPPDPTIQQAAPVQPIPSQQPTQTPAGVVDQNAMQAALNGSAATQSQPIVDQPVDAEDSQLYEDENNPDEEVDPTQPVSWTAHEYIHQEKGTLWFVLFGIVTLGLIGLSVFVRDWILTAVIVVIAFVVIVYLRRPPRELNYTLNEEGLLVDGKLYKYDDFKSFGVIRDGEEYSVMLIPVQRFQPGVTVYFPEESGEDIVDVLGERLPMKDLKMDAVDRLVRMLRL